MRLIGLVVFAGILCGTLIGCSKGAPFDDRATFNASFSQPVVVRVPVTGQGGDVEAIDYPCIVAQLFEKKVASYAPTLDGEPWIRVQSQNLSPDGNYIQVFSGQREFDSAKNIERFNRDGNAYFAETVTYYVRGSSLLDPPSPKGFGPFTSRIVYVRDPAVGEWRVETPVSDQAQVNITGAIEVMGCPRDKMTDAAEKAHAEAMNMFERKLAGEGTIEKTADPAIVVSAARKIAIFKGWANENKLDAVAVESLTQMARGECQKLRRGSYHWRLPTFQDFYRFTKEGARADFRVLQDTPDKRVWGDLVPQLTNNTYNYFVLETDAPPYRLYEAYFRQNDIVLGMYMNISHPRILCVADL